MSEIPVGTWGPARKQDWLVALAAGGIAILLGSVMADLLGLGLVDDAFISLRYAKNWAGGLGLVFNPGERVEGYTNFLLVFLEAVLVRLGVDPVAGAKLLGWLTLGALAGTVAFWAGRLLYPSRPVLAVLASLLVALNPLVLCWTLSGLESSLYGLLVLLAASCVLGEGERKHPVRGAILLILAAMARPEGVLLFPILTLLYVVGGGTRRGASQFALLFIVGYGVYFLLRALHFQSLFPNSFYAKLDYGNLRLLVRGLRYAGLFALAAPLLILSPLLGLLLGRRPRWVQGFLVLAGVQILIVAYEGGDHFALFRFMVPIVPILGLLSLYSWLRLARRIRVRALTREGLAAIGPAVLVASSFIVSNTEFKEYQVSHLERFKREVSYAQCWAEMGEHLRQRAPRGASLSTAAIGAIGYYSGLNVIDPHGIANREIGRRTSALGRGYPGHEKYDVDYVLSRRPAYLLLLNLPVPAPVPEEAARRIVWGDFNKAIIRDPRLRSDYRYENLRLRGRCWGIHVRNDLPPIGDGAG